jgi:hypothetical protein
LTTVLNPASVGGSVYFAFKFGLARRISTNTDQVAVAWLLLFSILIYIVVFGAVLMAWWLIRPETLTQQGLMSHFASAVSGRWAALYIPAFVLLGFVFYMYATGAEGNIVGFFGIPAFLLGSVLYLIATGIFMMSAQSPFRAPVAAASPEPSLEAAASAASGAAADVTASSAVNSPVSASQKLDLKTASPESLNQGPWAWPKWVESLPWWVLVLLWGTILNPVIINWVIEQSPKSRIPFSVTGHVLPFATGASNYLIWLALTWLLAYVALGAISFSTWTKAYLLHSSVFAWFAGAAGLLGLAVALLAGPTAAQVVLSFGVLAQLVAAGLALWSRISA